MLRVTGTIMLIVSNQRQYNSIQTGVKTDTWLVNTIKITESLMLETSDKNILIHIELLGKETLISLIGRLQNGATILFILKQLQTGMDGMILKKKHLNGS